MHQITDKVKKPAYALFIDFATASYHVDRDLVLKTVCQRLTPMSNTKLVQLMESPYSHTTIALAQTPDNNFQLPMGIQGRPQFTPHFNLFMHFVMQVFLDKYTNIGIKFLQRKYGILASAIHSKRATVGQHTLGSVGYPDDLVLLF